MDRLTNEIKQFFEDCKETEESKERTNEVRRRVKVIVNEKNPGADVLIVGSCGNGFGTRNSDVDLTINVPGSFLNSIGTDLLFTIQRRLLRDKASYTDVVVLNLLHLLNLVFNLRVKVYFNQIYVGAPCCPLFLLFLAGGGGSLSSAYNNNHISVFLRP